MNCEILQTLYIKSNGEILCNDDYGERVHLGQIDSQASLDMDILFVNDAYTTIRRALARNTVPWPGICEHCAFLRHDEPYVDTLGDKRISKLQLEPSLLCNLNCLGCTNDQQIRNRKKPHMMKPETFELVLRTLKSQEYLLDSIEYCGQGEPLMHTRFSEFVEIAKRYYPSAWQRLITNGNFSYEKTVGSAPVDEIIVAGDGFFQESYSQYRVRGDITKVLKFVQAAVAAKQKGRPIVIWKYILFEFNDSTEELLAVQEKIAELGVDTLVFVVTHSAHRSQLYTMKTVTDLPIIKSNVTTNAHPVFYDGAVKGSIKKPLVQRLSELVRKNCLAQIDDVMLMPDNLLQIRGWAASVNRVGSIHLNVGNLLLGETQPTGFRPDVADAFPSFPFQPMEFRLSAQLPEGTGKTIDITLKVMDKDAASERCFKMKCTFDTPIA